MDGDRGKGEPNARAHLRVIFETKTKITLTDGANVQRHGTRHQEPAETNGGGLQAASPGKVP